MNIGIDDDRNANISYVDNSYDDDGGDGNDDNDDVDGDDYNPMII